MIDIAARLQTPPMTSTSAASSQLWARANQTVDSPWTAVVHTAVRTVDLSQPVPSRIRPPSTPPRPLANSSTP
ncbi:MAG TPA: hypothetical protein VG164_10180 [Trebonia sp.]|nr:hypothetical protein [Trebonia sp.]